MNLVDDIEKITCPNCGSKNVKIIVNEKDNYDITSGILGAICLGPIGMLCGLCCADSEENKIFCICNECETKFNG